MLHLELELKQHIRSLSRKPAGCLKPKDFLEPMNISFDRTDTIPTPLPRRHGLILMDNDPPAASTSALLLHATLFCGAIWL